MAKFLRIYIEDICLFRWKIRIYFIEWAPDAIFSRVAKPRVKISFLVFTRWNKFRSSAETNKFSFYFMPFPWLLSLNSKKVGHASLEIAPQCVHKNDVIMTSRPAGTVSRCISWFLFLYWPVTKSWYFSLLFFTANSEISFLFHR